MVEAEGHHRLWNLQPAHNRLNGSSRMNGSGTLCFVEANRDRSMQFNVALKTFPKRRLVYQALAEPNKISIHLICHADCRLIIRVQDRLEIGQQPYLQVSK